MNPLFCSGCGKYQGESNKLCCKLFKTKLAQNLFHRAPKLVEFVAKQEEEDEYQSFCDAPSKMSPGYAPQSPGYAPQSP